MLVQFMAWSDRCPCRRMWRALECSVLQKPVAFSIQMEFGLDHYNLWSHAEKCTSCFVQATTKALLWFTRRNAHHWNKMDIKRLVGESGWSLRLASAVSYSPANSAILVHDGPEVLRSAAHSATGP